MTEVLSPPVRQRDRNESKHLELHLAIRRRQIHRRTSKRLLLVPAILAGVLHPRRASFGLQPVRRAAFAADRLDPGVALFDDEVFLFHRLADQALSLLTH